MILILTVLCFTQNLHLLLNTFNRKWFLHVTYIKHTVSVKCMLRQLPKFMFIAQHSL